MKQVQQFDLTATNRIKPSRLLVGVFLVLIGISSPIVDALAQSEATTRARAALPRGETKIFETPPAVATGPLHAELQMAIDTAFGDNLRAGIIGPEQIDALQRIADSKDVRVAWIVSDLMRFTSNSQLTATAGNLMGVELNTMNAWGDTTDRLIAWDVPAPPGYLDVKRRIFSAVLPAWEPLFTEGNIEWRHVSWGGVRIDDRPFGETDTPCNCIPAADNPKVTDVAGAKWLSDDAVVFGIEVNGEYRAYPRRIMEVREMVNDTLGGRHLGIPYCTLCGSAQAYFTDRLPDGVKRPVVRTSGLLIRSNKVMYDVNTFSVFDTFRGTAVTGPLAKRGVVLKQTGVVTALWGKWKAAHPSTTVLAEELALGQDFNFRNNRDAQGPIFPIGDIDQRLAVQEDVLGIVTDSGTPIAFHIETALAALSRGETIIFENVQLMLDGGGVRAVNVNGEDLGGHQAFWFAWSQFYPQTRLWPF